MIDKRLIANLRRFPTRADAVAYLDFVGDVFVRLDLRGDDPRFHFNPTSSSYGLPLTINNRYVAAHGRPARGQPPEPTWWLLHPGWAYMDEDVVEQVRGHFAFAHKRHDLPDGPPLMVRLLAAFVLKERERLLELVLDCARRDLSACRATPARLCHSADAYACVLDEEAREFWLHRAFSGAMPDV